jgi:Zn-dependent protease with chaperone function
MTPILILPVLGTLLGAAMVYFVRGTLHTVLHKLLLGFASGVMVAASIWSLLLPSMEMSSTAGQSEWIPAAVGFVLGILFLLLLDTLIPHLHIGSTKPEGLAQKKQWKRSTMLAVAVTLHNIPEGMAVGVILASALAESYKNVKAEYDNVLSTIENYESASESLDALVIGTDEWKEALIEANEAALKLIDNFNLIKGEDYIINTDGSISFTKAG